MTQGVEATVTTTDTLTNSESKSETWSISLKEEVSIGPKDVDQWKASASFSEHDTKAEYDKAEHLPNIVYN